MADEIDLTGIPHKELQPIIEKVRKRIKKHLVVKNMFKEYKIDLDEIDLVPMCFAKIDVSARTDHGIIYFNVNLLEDKDFEKDDHYMVHELTHFLQQTTGTKPTQGSDEGSYLDNKYEIEGFNNQSEFISDTRGDKEAEKYIDQVLDHHDIDDERERERRKNKLLELAEN